jgi:hypothetical protein
MFQSCAKTQNDRSKHSFNLAENCKYKLTPSTFFARLSASAHYRQKGNEHLVNEQTLPPMAVVT